MGAAAMAAFWLGSVPALTVGSGAVGLLARSGPWGRRAVAVAVLGAGLWSISVRATPAPDGTPSCHHAGG